MSLTFYYSPMSTASVTQLVLEELGVPVEKILVDIKKGETRTPEFLAMNPNGKVPLVVHDGTPLWESAALTMYLGETFGVEPKLYPPPGTQRGEAMTWIAWGNVSLGEAFGRVGRNAHWAPEEQRNAAAGAAAAQDVQALLHILDGALAKRPFLVGDYTLADTHVHSFTDWLRFAKTDFSPFPHLNAWAERCRARPAYQRVMGAH